MFLLRYGTRILCLSVSSVGSEAMQPGSRPIAECGQLRLSVSSVGSEAMQLADGEDAVPYTATFSILGRIGGDATFVLWRYFANSCHFQYPRSDRRRCNSSWSSWA